MMETLRPRNGGQHLPAQRQPMGWRTTAAVLLLALGILKTASGGAPQFSPRVVGGHDAEEGCCPWQAYVLYRGRGFCSAIVLSDSWVVTAAHCVDGKDYSQLVVMMGVLNLTGENPTKVTVSVTTVIIHDKYGGDGTSGDLAVMQLESAVTFNKNIGPIKLPYQDQAFANGLMCELHGWGYTAEDVKLKAPHPLQQVELPLMNHTACNEMFKRSLNSSADFELDVVKEDMICAGYPEGKKDGCQGDSGGGLTCLVDGCWLLVGIVSWGNGCARPLSPGVYTFVSKFSAWVQEKIAAAPLSETTATNTTVKVDSPVTNKPQVASQMDAATVSESETATVTGNSTVTEKPEVASPTDFATVSESETATSEVTISTTQQPTSHAVSLSAAIDQSTTSAGRRLQTSVSLLSLVIVCATMSGVV